MNCYIDIHTHRPTGLHTELTAIGVHPWDAQNAVIEEEKFASSEAIGEIGLDFACEVNREQQLTIFEEQLQLAERYNKPVVLHCVKAFEQTMILLAKYDLRAVIFHGFIGSKELAKQATNRGYYLSFGDRTWRSPKTIETLRNTPINNIFLETDDADTTIEEQYLKVTHVKQLSLNDLQLSIIDNYNRIFNYNE